MNDRETKSGKIKVCHLISGDIWAGAEVQAAILLSKLVKHHKYDVQAVVFNNGRLSWELIKSGVKVVIFDEKKYTSVAIFKKLLKFFKTESIDIFHSHRYKENVLGSLAAKLGNVPCIIRTVHGVSEIFLGFEYIKMAAYRYLDDLTGKYFTDKIIAVSMDIKNTLQKQYQKDKVICIYNAIDLGHANTDSNPEKTRTELQISQSDRVIGTIGRLTLVKGIEYFLKAARIIVDKRSDVTFLIVGDGPLRTSLEQLSRKLQIEKFVKFVGYREDIYNLINIMDVFVLSSLHEGIPTVLLEALAMGRPVVATRVGGIPEVLEQEDLGLLTEPENMLQLAEACFTLLDVTDANELKLKRRQYVAQKFSSERMSEKVIELYEALLGLRC